MAPCPSRTDSCSGTCSAPVPVELCPAALYEGELVANVLVAIQTCTWASCCAAESSTKPHPDHRKHGLARALMEDAHRLMQDRMKPLSCTRTRTGIPTGSTSVSVTFRRRWELPYPADALRKPARAAEEATVADERDTCLLDEHYRCWGYAPMVDDLWRWHRRERPAEMPIQLVVVRGAATAGGCLA